MFVKTNISNLYLISNQNYLKFYLFFSKKDIINYIKKIYQIPVSEVNTQILYKKRIFKKNSKTNFKGKYNIFKGKYNIFKKVFLRLYKNKYVICQ
ncbi:hypothetical protein [Candidatus Karelsulcia muelleri]|uniref:hypothetical protein n=1 Tax=Candidatus Karelsulcia muelleri TaxID=336810 RepID=UPI000B92EA0C|nr:hypothetical protein [Candidatus Karelsulcia muelleri]ASS46970.1 hypothetical protein CA211_200 [Candidatus Karelsulcia muelleri]